MSLEPPPPPPPRKIVSNYPRGDASREGPLFLPEVLNGKKEVVMGMILAAAAPFAVHFSPIGFAFPLGSLFLGYLALSRGNNKGLFPIIAAPFGFVLALISFFSFRV